MGVIDINSAVRKSESEYSHSKKLEWIIRDFISQSGYGYYDDEISCGVLKNYFKLKNDICVEQEIIIREKDCLCYTTLSVALKEDDEKYSIRLFDLLVEINDINCLLDYGNFEYHMDSGDIRFKTCYEPNEGLICCEDLDKFLGYSHFAINKYGDRILKALE